MGDSSSEDEEEILRNFDKEARIIVQTETLPKKSSDRYQLVYQTNKKWREENKKSLSNSEENNLIVYFEKLKIKVKPPTLWSVWSMLRKTSSAEEDINIRNFIRLKSIIKTNAKGYKPRKAFGLKWEQILQFMDEAPNDIYLVMKVILIFGVCGCLRCDEITKLKVQDVKDLKDKYLVSINDNKNDYAGQFIIGEFFYDKVKKYISLRPPDQFSDRFFIKYQSGKCFRQPMGRHKIGEVPENIASYLQLPNAKRYTGHCFRRTSATLLSNCGVNMQMVKQLGRRHSDMIAEGYIENSMHKRQLIYDGVVQKNTAINNPKPSTSAQVIIEKENDEFNSNLNSSNFDENYNPNNLDLIPSEVVDSGFTTGRKKQILVPIKKKNEPVIPNSKSFLSKPSIKLNFRNEVIVQPPPCKKKKSIKDFDSKNYNDISATLKKDDLKFENCTFNNCVFNLTSCNCNEENNS